MCQYEILIGRRGRAVSAAEMLEMEHGAAFIPFACSHSCGVLLSLLFAEGRPRDVGSCRVPSGTRLVDMLAIGDQCSSGYTYSSTHAPDLSPRPSKPCEYCDSKVSPYMIPWISGLNDSLTLLQLSHQCSSWSLRGQTPSSLPATSSSTRTPSPRRFGNRCG